MIARGSSGINTNLVFDIQQANVKKLCEPEGYDTFTETLYRKVDGEYRVEKFETTDDQVTITIDDKEGDKEPYVWEALLSSAIDSLWASNREALNAIMLQHNLSQEEMNRHIGYSVNFLNMSPKHTGSCVFSIKLHS